jgi:tetratricopeptide (TPR) repeat protein
MSTASLGQAQADPDAVRLWETARRAFRDRRYADAAELLQRLVDRGPEAPGLNAAAVRLLYGVTLLRCGRTEEGVSELRIAVALDPASARAHHKLGAGLARLGRDAEALPFFERATALAPDIAEHHWRLGEQQRRLGQADKARASFERALELDPGYGPARDGLEALKRSRRSWLADLTRRFQRRRSGRSARG